MTLRYLKIKPVLLLVGIRSAKNSFSATKHLLEFRVAVVFGKEKVGCYYFPTKVLNGRIRKVRAEIEDRGNSDSRSDPDLIIAVTVCSLEVQGCPEVVSSPRLCSPLETGSRDG